jgi:hypothetical protein
VNKDGQYLQGQLTGSAVDQFVSVAYAARGRHVICHGVCELLLLV